MTDFTRESAFSFERTTISTVGLVRDVQMLGPNSKNGYKYREAAMRKAATLYKGKDVYSNHITSDADVRKQEDKIGFIASEGTYRDGKVFADVQFNPMHAAYPAIKWWIENAPSKLGMSHYALLKREATTGDVVDVAEIASVDLVAEPATTQGMFGEGVVGDALAVDMQRQLLASLVCKAHALIMDIVYPIQANLTDVEKSLKIRPIVADLEAELAKFNPDETAQADAATGTSITKPDGYTDPTVQSSEGNKMDLKELTIEELRTARPDIVTAIATESVAAEREVDAKVAEAIKPVDAKLHSKVFLKLVRESIVAKNVEVLAELIEDRKSLAIEVPTSGSTIAHAKESVAPAGGAAKKVAISEDDILAAFA